MADPVIEDHLCGSCRWSDPNVLDDGGGSTDEERLVLLCRRYPPVPLGFDDDGVANQYWPQVADVDWCGEWATAG